MWRGKPSWTKSSVFCYSRHAHLHPWTTFQLPGIASGSGGIYFRGCPWQKQKRKHPQFSLPQGKPFTIGMVAFNYLPWLSLSRVFSIQSFSTGPQTSPAFHSRLPAPVASVRFWRQAQGAKGRGSPKTLMEKSLQVDGAARWEVSACQHSSETGNSEVTWFIRWNAWLLILSDSSLPWHLSLLRLVSVNQVCFSLLGFISVNQGCLFYVTDPMLTVCWAGGAVGDKMKKTIFYELSAPGELYLPGSWSDYWTHYTPSIWNNFLNSIELPVSVTLYGTQEASNKYLLNQWNNRLLLTATQVEQLRSACDRALQALVWTYSRQLDSVLKEGRDLGHQRGDVALPASPFVIRHRRSRKLNPIDCVPALPNRHVPCSSEDASCSPGTLELCAVAGRQKAAPGCSGGRYAARSAGRWGSLGLSLRKSDPSSLTACRLQGINAFSPVMLCQIRRSLSCPS